MIIRPQHVEDYQIGDRRETLARTVTEAFPHGYVVERVEVFDQEGATVLVSDHLYLVRRRGEG